MITKLEVLTNGLFRANLPPLLGGFYSSDFWSEKSTRRKMFLFRTKKFCCEKNVILDISDRFTI
jgi:hypothetical protein